MIVATGWLIAASATAAPFASSGWKVFNTPGCEAALIAPGRKDQPTVVTVRTMPLGDLVELTVTEPATAGAASGNGRGRIDGPGGRIAGEYSRYFRPAPAGLRSVSTLTFRRSALVRLAAGPATMRSGGLVSRFTIVHPADLAAIIVGCNVALRAQWSIPDLPYGVAREARPISDRSRWFAPTSYPAAALAKRIEPTTHVIWRIDESGRVERCGVVFATGNPALDDAVCRVLKTRARYTAARDTAGRPVARWAWHTVRW